VEGAENIAELCKKHQAFPVHISTDYVFARARASPIDQLLANMSPLRAHDDEGPEET